VKHLRVAHTSEEIEQINSSNMARKRSTRVGLLPKMEQGGAACLAQLGPDDELVDAALEAECDNCRIAVGVAKKDDKTWENQKPIGVKPVQTWEATPMAGADDLIASAMKNRG